MEVNGMVYRMDAPLHALLRIQLVISLTGIGKLRTAGEFEKEGLSRKMARGKALRNKGAYFMVEVIPLCKGLNFLRW